MGESHSMLYAKNYIATPTQFLQTVVTVSEFQAAGNVRISVYLPSGALIHLIVRRSFLSDMVYEYVYSLFYVTGNISHYPCCRDLY